MSVPIRKLLSRKFNIVCLNKAGLLTRFKLFYLPICAELDTASFFRTTPKIIYRYRNEFGTSSGLKKIASPLMSAKINMA